MSVGGKTRYAMDDREESGHGEEASRMSGDQLFHLAGIVARAIRFAPQRDPSRLWGRARRCLRCAKVIPRDDPFCAYCGAPQSSGEGAAAPEPLG